MFKQIGIFGGSFDPIHNGHLNLAVELMEAHSLDEVWFIPAACSPFKQFPTATSAQDRLAMTALAIAGETRFRVLDLEINREGPSYTVDTLKTLVEAQKGQADPCTFALILGDDTARGFSGWHHPEAIVQLARLLVGSRGLQKEPFKGSPQVIAALEAGMTPTRIMEVSSTEIRQRLKEGMYCGHLVPGKVLDYIFSHQLYLSKREICDKRN